MSFSSNPAGRPSKALTALVRAVVVAHPAQSIVQLLYPHACVLCHDRLTITYPNTTVGSGFGAQGSWPVVEGAHPASRQWQPAAQSQGGVGTSSKTATLFCEACAGGMTKILPPVCQCCGLGVAGAYDALVRCRRCQIRRFAFEHARAPFIYVDTVREAIHAFKYQGRRRVGMWLAEHMAHTARQALPLSEIDLVVSVPLHWLKARWKGTNPAAVLACAVAGTLQRPCHLKALSRVRWTPTQTRLGTRQRFRNVRGAFRASPRDVDQRGILLIDDVFTSGATVHACAEALRNAGARAVFVLTAATTPKP